MSTGWKCFRVFRPIKKVENILDFWKTLGRSKAGLGKLSKLRVYNINGGKLTGKDLKEEPVERYCEYADRFIKENTGGAIDWSIFEGEQAIMDVNSGTQVLLRRYGTDHGILSGNILS